MAYPAQGERVEQKVRLPKELHDWLEAEARPGGPDSYCPAGRTVNDLIVQGVLLLRELRAGIPSPVSTALLDQALADLDAPRLR